MDAAAAPPAVDARLAALHRRIASAIAAGHVPRITGANTLRIGGVGNRGGYVLGRRGALNAAGEYYQRQQGDPLDIFDRDRGLVDEGRRSYAFLRDGRRVSVRYRREDGEWRLTVQGQAFFQDLFTEYMVWAPVLSLSSRDVGDRKRWHSYIDRTRDYIAFMERTAFPGDEDMPPERPIRARERGNDPEADIAEVKAVAQRMLQGGDPYFTLRQVIEDGRVAGNRDLDPYLDYVVMTLLISDVILLWDPRRDFRVDRRETTVGRGLVPDVNVILDRPLRGKITMPGEMYARYGLHDLAREDTGECMLSQFLVCAKKSGRVRETNDLGRVVQRRVSVPLMTVDKAVAAFNEAFHACHKADEWPYDYPEAHWRTTGVTCRMLEYVCRKHEISLYVMHLSHLVYKFEPPTKKHNHDTVLCLNVWGDHAFFYEDSDVKSGIARMAVRKPMVAVPAKLKDFEEHERVPYDSVSPFSWEAVVDAVEASRSADFHTDDLDLVLRHLETSDYQYSRVFGTDFNVPVGYNIRPRRKPRNTQKEGVRDRTVRIRREPDFAGPMNDFCKVLNHQNRLKVVYRGESESTLCLHVVQELLFKRRPDQPEDVKARILEAQDGRCAHCGDALRAGKELDHRVPRSRGGEDDEANLQYLCGQCHRDKTDEEGLSPCVARTLESQFNPEVYESFHNAPKPQQLSRAFVDDDGELLKVHSRCRYVTQGWDVVGCRTNALLETQHGLPVFCTLDEPVPLSAYVPGYDYYRVHTCVDPEPWSGDRWYWCEAVKYMLEIGSVLPEHCTMGLKASQHVDPAALAAALQKIKVTWDDVEELLEQRRWCHMEGKVWPYRGPERLRSTYEAVGSGMYDYYGHDADYSRVYKKMRLGLVGLMNSQTSTVWSSRRTSCTEDVPGDAVHTKRYVGEGIWEFMVGTELKSLSSLRPIGQIALDMEQVRVHQVLRLAMACPDVRVLGVNVDCVVLQDAAPVPKRSDGSRGICDPAIGRCFVDQTKTPAIKALEDGIEAIRYPRSGEPVFRCVHNPFAPQHAMPRERRDGTFFPQPHEWRHERRQLSPAELADLIVENGGAMLTGPPGVGKTHTMRRVTQRLRASGKAVHIMAYTHSASRLVGGDTALHFLHAHRRLPSDTWIVVDEASQVHTRLWGSLAEYHLLGCKFVVMGDFRGQYLPIGDPFAHLLDRTETSSLMHSLCAGFHVHLSENHRCKSDPGHFDFYCSLYGLAEEDAFATAQRMASRFPAGDLLEWGADHYLCRSHTTRMRINAYVNERVRRPGSYFVEKHECRNAPTEPQAMWVWPDMELIASTREKKAVLVTDDTGRTRKEFLLHGCVYKVVEVNERFVEVEMLRDFWKPMKPEAPPRSDDSDADDEGSDYNEDDVEDPEDRRAYPGVLVLTHEQASKYLRPQHALTYASIQGRTLRDSKVAMLDLPLLNLRQLMVASSRVTEGRLLRCADPAAQNRLMADIQFWERERGL